MNSASPAASESVDGPQPPNQSRPGASVDATRHGLPPKERLLTIKVWDLWAIGQRRSTDNRSAALQMNVRTRDDSLVDRFLGFSQDVAAE